MVCGHEVTERIATELLAGRTRELPRKARFGNDRQGLDGGGVTALDERLRRVARLQVDRRERTHQGRERLHRYPRDDLLAVRDAAFDPTGSIRLPVQAAFVAEDLVVCRGAAFPLERKPFPDLDALDRLRAHQRR